MQWFRWYHGSCSDLKMGSVARRADATKERVIAVWAMLLESASESDDRGRISIDAEGIADCLGCETESVAAILAAMQVKGMVGRGCVTNWTERQRPVDDSSERVRRHRAKRAETLDIQPDVTAVTVTVAPPEKEEELEREKETTSSVLKLTARDTTEEHINSIMIAANRGMLDNPKIGDGCNPISISHASRQSVYDWLSAGVPPEVARSAVYDRAKEYLPSENRRQVTTLKYFNGAVMDAFERHKAAQSEVPNGHGNRNGNGTAPGKVSGAAGAATGTDGRAWKYE